MAVIFGAIVILFLLAVLVVKTLDADELYPVDELIDEQPDQIARTHNETNPLHALDMIGCNWTDQLMCTIECNGLTIDAIDDRLTDMWTKNDCQTHPLDLVINGDVFNVTNMHPNQTRSPFKSPTIVFVKTLTLRYTRINYLSSSLFDGFIALTTLNLSNVTVHDANEHMLDPIAATVETIIISAASANSTALELASFTGGILAKRRLRTVRVRYRLIGGRLTAATLAGADRLEVLNLAACQIETIGPNAFDRLIYLEVLNLDDNRLRTIPTGLFDRILPSFNLYIYMRNNAWSCDCEVCYLKSLLRDFWWNFMVNTDVCRLPDGLADLADPSEYCSVSTCRTLMATTTPIPVSTSFATPIITPPPMTTPAGPFDPLEPSTDLHCAPDQFPTFVVEVVKVQSRNRIVRVLDNLDGTVNVTIQMPAYLSTMLVWFDNADQHFQSLLPAPAGSKECRFQRGSNQSLSQTLTLDIRPLVPYTFCVMTNITEQFVVSPFNCVSFNKQTAATDSDSRPWFMAEAKTFTVAMLCVGIVLIFVFGLILGYALLRRFPLCRRQCTGHSSSDAAPPKSSVTNSRTTRRGSELSTISYAISADEPPSRFEIVQRQLALAHDRHHRRYKADESPYYLQSFVGTGNPNIYESSCATPVRAAPAQPPVAPSPADRSLAGGPEQENYYSNAELLGKRA